MPSAFKPTAAHQSDSSNTEQSYAETTRPGIPGIYSQKTHQLGSNAVAETLGRAAPAIAECVKSRWRFRNQYLSMCCANIITMGQGCTIGWMSPALLHFQSSHDSPLGHGATTSEISWIASTSSVGAALGAIVFGLICARIGSRNSTLLCAVPLSFFWLIVMLSNQAWQICVGRMLSGLTGGVFVSMQLFLADISDEQIRGRLGTFLSLYLNCGVLLGYVAGTTLDYATVPYVMISFPVLFLCGFSFVPNTPQYLLTQGDVVGAEQSLRFYKNCPEDSADNKHFMKEFEHLQSVAHAREISPAVRLADFGNRPAIRAMFIGLTLMAINQFSGAFLIITYASRIFQESGSDVDPRHSTIVLGALQIVATYVTSLCIDRVGRRVLLIVSASGTALGLGMMVAYTHLAAGPCDVSQLRLVPLISLSFVTIVASLGLGSVPYVIIAEVLPQKIRNIGTTICTTTVSVYAFIMLKSFPHLKNVIGLPHCMTIFLCVACLGIVFIVFCVPETKGKQLNELEKVEPVSGGRQPESA